MDTLSLPLLADGRCDVGGERLAGHDPRHGRRRRRQHLRDVLRRVGSHRPPISEMKGSTSQLLPGIVFSAVLPDQGGGAGGRGRGRAPELSGEQANRSRSQRCPTQVDLQDVLDRDAAKQLAASTSGRLHGGPARLHQPRAEMPNDAVEIARGGS